MIDSLGDIRAVLAAGDPADKLQLYRALDLEVRFKHQQQLAIVGTTLVELALVSEGGTDPYPNLAFAADLQLP